MTRDGLLAAASSNIHSVPVGPRRAAQIVVAAVKLAKYRVLLFHPDQKYCVSAASDRRIGQRDARFGLSADDGGAPSVELCKHCGA